MRIKGFVHSAGPSDAVTVMVFVKGPRGLFAEVGKFISHRGTEEYRSVPKEMEGNMEGSLERLLWKVFEERMEGVVATFERRMREGDPFPRFHELEWDL